MYPSILLTYIAAFLALAIWTSLAYIQFGYTPRRIERTIKAWVSPVNLVLFMVVIVAAFCAATGN